MNYKNLKTSDLVEKCIDRDGVAWAEFVKRFSSLIEFSVKNAFAKYSTDPARHAGEIKDVMQNVMVSLWSKNTLSDVKQKGSINYWLAVTARNATANYLRARGKDAVILEEDYLEKLAVSAGEEKPDEERLADMNKKINEFYNSLSEKEKLVFKLYFEKSLSLKDISKIIASPVGTVSSIVTRIRKKIKK